MVQVSSGIGYDFSPVPDTTLSPLLPGSDRIPVTLGTSILIPSTSIKIDASYMMVYFIPRTINSDTGKDKLLGDSSIRFRAHYETIAHLFGLNLLYAWDDISPLRFMNAGYRRPNGSRFIFPILRFSDSSNHLLVVLESY